MSIPYVKLEPQEIASSRKEILEAQMNILKMLTQLKEYSKLRKVELTRKANLKSLLKQKTLNLVRLINELPQQEKIKIHTKHVSKSNQIEHELFEISQKLKKMR
jgi:hypothetical protein